MSFLEHLPAHKINPFISLAKDYFGEDEDNLRRCIERLTVFFSISSAHKLDNEPTVEAFLRFAENNGIFPTDDADLSAFFDRGSGTDATLDRGTRTLDWILGEKLPNVLQSVKSDSDMRPSSSQQITKLFAALFFSNLVQALQSARNDEGDPLTIVSTAAIGAHKHIDEVVSHWLANADLSADVPAKVPRTEPKLLHRLLPWILLAIAALLLLYILNKGCAATIPAEETGDAIIHEM